MSNLPVTFPVADGEVRLRGALVEIDETTGRAKTIRRIDEPGPVADSSPTGQARTEPETPSTTGPKL